MTNLVRQYFQWIILIGGIVLFFVVRYGLGYDGLYGQDSYEYIRYAAEIKSLFLTGKHPGNFYWPEGYPLLVALFGTVISVNFAGQLISVAAFVFTLWFTYKIIQQVYGEDDYAHWYVLVSLLLAPYVFRLFVSSMSDPLAICCLMGSIYFALRYQKNHGFLVLFMCVLMGSYAIFTRYACVIPVSILFLYLIYGWSKNILWSHLLVLFIPALIFGIHLYFDSGVDLETLDKSVDDWSINNFFKSSHQSNAGSRTYLVPNIVFTLFYPFHFGFFTVGVLLIIPSIKRKTSPLILWIIWLSYSIFLAGFSLQNKRLVTLTFPIFLILLYGGISPLVQFIGSKKAMYIMVGLMSIQIILVGRAFAPIYNYNQLEKRISQKMKAHEGNILYVFGIDQALKGRGLDFEYRNLWEKEYERFDKGSYVFFNESKFEKKWEGKTPMINWSNLQNNYSLDTIQSFEQGWVLYKIE